MCVENKMDALISVIIPVYNVEHFLDRCVQSVLKQSYKNIEIILVDDGSPDSSGEMCDKYASENLNVICVHKTNGGLSSARNAGLQVAHGDFIGFIDSDDWIALDMYEYLLSLCINHNCDVAQIALKQVYSHLDQVVQPKEKIQVYKDKEILQHYLYTSTVTGCYSVCRCLFKRKVVEGIFFRNGKINEDIDFKYKVLAKSKTLVVSNLYKYFYFQSTGSMTTSGLKKRDFQLYEVADILANLTSKEKYGTIAKLGLVKRARTPFSLLSRIAYYGYSDEITERENLEKKLIQEHRKNTLTLLFSPIPLSRKVLTIMFSLNFPIAKKIISFVKRI